MTETKTKREFCESLGWPASLGKVTWLDKTGIVELPAGRLARLELETLGTSGEYCGFLVTILGICGGRIDQKFFEFDDYLDRSDEGRADGRAHGPNQYPEGERSRCFKVVAHCGWKWYIAKPRAAGAFTFAVAGYVEAFRWGQR